MKKTIFLLLIFLCISSMAFAKISINIKGNSRFKLKDSNLYIQGNWKNTSNDSTSLETQNSSIIFAGTGQDTIYNSSGSFSKLVIKNPDGVKLQSPVNVTDSLNLVDGNVDNSDFDVNLSDSATVNVGTGQLTNPPVYQNIIEVAYTGNVPVVTGNELPDSVDFMIMSNSAGVTLSKNVYIDSTLTFTKGMLQTTDSLFITLSPHGRISEQDSSHIVGNVETDWIYVGTDSLDRLGLFISPGPDNIGYAMVTRNSGPTTPVVLDSTESIAKKWTVVANSVPTNGRDIRVSWFSDEDNDINLVAAQGWQSTDDQQSWFAVSDSQDVTDSRTIMIDEITTFGSFTVGDLYKLITGEFDLNGDGITDIKDIQIITAVFGSQNSEDLAKYDFNDNNRVDKGDIKEVIQNWGKTWDIAGRDSKSLNRSKPKEARSKPKNLRSKSKDQD